MIETLYFIVAIGAAFAGFRTMSEKDMATGRVVIMFAMALIWPIYIGYVLARLGEDL